MVGELTWPAACRRAGWPGGTPLAVGPESGLAVRLARTFFQGGVMATHNGNGTLRDLIAGTESLLRSTAS
ncbi:hypothetical protein L7Q78_45585, partial [Achromobacter xylosoxidans]|nr:hypothetical protein [Achromobacter xylosoxidans]